MFAPDSVYSNRQSIPIAFDLDDPEQAELLRAFEASFGERYAILEDLYPPRHLYLSVLPGGALEIAR